MLSLASVSGIIEALTCLLRQVSNSAADVSEKLYCARAVANLTVKLIEKQPNTGILESSLCLREMNLLCVCAKIDDPDGTRRESVPAVNKVQLKLTNSVIY